MKREEIEFIIKQGNFRHPELVAPQELVNCYFIKQRKFTTNDFIKGLQISDKKFEPVTVMEAKGLFADQVQEFFETTTGLRTCL